jgi:hypothetical protein
MTRSNAGKFASLLFAATLAASVLCNGCTVHAGYYDSYYHDYHPVSGEVVYYNQWERDTHRDHVELKDRNKDDQKAYWDWRHSQGGH